MKETREQRKSFLNKHNERLWGLLDVPQNKKKSPGLIMCHGFCGSKEAKKFAKLAKTVSKEGIASFRFDFSGHGDSEGILEDLSIEKEIEDLRSAYKAFIKDTRIDEERVAILGHSLGALIAVVFQARYKKAKALILLSPALLHRELINKWYDFEEIDLWEKQGYLDTPKGRIGAQYLRDAKKKNWVEAVSQIEVPTLVIHGSQDDDIPQEYAERVVEKLKAPKKFLLISGDHHFENSRARRKLIQVSCDWLKKYL